MLFIPDMCMIYFCFPFIWILAELSLSCTKSQKTSINETKWSKLSSYTLIWELEELNVLWLMQHLLYNQKATRFIQLLLTMILGIAFQKPKMELLQLLLVEIGFHAAYVGKSLFVTSQISLDYSHNKLICLGDFWHYVLMSVWYGLHFTQYFSVIWILKSIFVIRSDVINMVLPRISVSDISFFLILTFRYQCAYQFSGYLHVCLSYFIVIFRISCSPVIELGYKRFIELLQIGLKRKPVQAILSHFKNFSYYYYF